MIFVVSSAEYPITTNATAPDADNDGFPDAFDPCINDPETKNLIAEFDGCPDSIPALIDLFDFSERLVTPTQTAPNIFTFVLQGTTNIEDFNIGFGTVTTHPDLIFDYNDSNGKPVYADKRIFEDASIIQYETQHGTVILDKSTCGFTYYNSGSVSEQNPPLFGDSVIARMATNGTDNWVSVNQINGQPCQPSIDGNKLTATRINSSVGSLSYSYIDTGVVLLKLSKFFVPPPYLIVSLLRSIVCVNANFLLVVPLLRFVALISVFHCVPVSM